uniref:Col_cuticle_N domain-containing protein n=1 Tax=Steinernema glaseri TaxID=37863 RepID=A0A1I8AGG8_9BILA
MTAKTEFQQEMEKFREAETFRRLAFVGIFLSTIAALTAIIAVPALYGYMQRIQSQLQTEAEYCKSATGTMWQQFAKTQAHKGVFERVKPQTGKEAFLVGTTLEDVMGAAGRAKRQAGYDTFVESAAVVNQVATQSIAHTCSCKIGPAGSAGAPGTDGQDGLDGLPGPDGKNGPDARPDELPKESDFCFDCPAGPAGPAGNAGPKGPTGNPGANGQDGAPGAPGTPGVAGPAGPKGQKGADGAQGPAGVPGVVKEVPVPAGPPGAPGAAGPQGPDGPKGADGLPGAVGPQGPAGDAGVNGVPGKDGEKGEQGPAGEQGPSGGCDHCPPPRTAPGY